MESCITVFFLQRRHACELPATSYGAIIRLGSHACCSQQCSTRRSLQWQLAHLGGASLRRGGEGVAIALSVTLSGGALFAS